MSIKSNLDFSLAGFWIFQSAPNSVPHPASFPNTSKGEHFSQGWVVLTLSLLHSIHILFSAFYQPIPLWMPLSTLIYIQQIIQDLFQNPTSPTKDLWRTPTPSDFSYLLVTSMSYCPVPHILATYLNIWFTCHIF